MPSAKHLSQNLFFRFRLRAILVMKSFLLKLKTMTACFEHGISHNDTNGNVHGNILSLKILQIATKIEIHQTFLRG